MKADNKGDTASQKAENRWLSEWKQIKTSTVLY